MTQVKFTTYRLLFFTQLLKKFGEVARVDIIDRLPTPFGLVRSGVAPDHPETKVDPGAGGLQFGRTAPR